MEDIKYKIRFFGDSRVGKQKIINQFVKGTVFDKESSFIGLSMYEKCVTIDNDIDILLQMWDSAGQEKYRCLTKQLFHGFNGILLVYDPNIRETFDKIDHWCKTIKDNIDIESVVVFLIENNQSKNKVNNMCTKEEGEKLANKLGFHFYSVNSYNGMNIEQCFHHLAKKLYEKHKKKERINDGKKNLLNLYCLKF